MVPAEYESVDHVGAQRGRQVGRERLSDGTYRGGSNIVGQGCVKEGAWIFLGVVPVAQTHGLPISEMVVNPCRSLVAP